MSVVKVSSIEDNRRLVLNAGSDAGVHLKDKFQIYGPGKDVIDPDTKDVLGQLEVEKLPVIVVHVEPKFSVAETFRYTETNVGGNFNSFALSSYLLPPKIVKKYETFEIDESTRKAIDEAKSLIKVGDIARKVEDGERVASNDAEDPRAIDARASSE